MISLSGPWQRDGSHIYGPDPNRHLICQIHYSGIPALDAEKERVLLAAPDLLEACKHMLDFCPPGLMPDLRAAIAKAEGVRPENDASTSH